ncbi:protein of unknown function [Burkholderia multivorans]
MPARFATAAPRNVQSGDAHGVPRGCDSMSHARRAFTSTAEVRNSLMSNGAEVTTPLYASP